MKKSIKNECASGVIILKVLIMAPLLALFWLAMIIVGWFGDKVEEYESSAPNWMYKETRSYGSHDVRWYIVPLLFLIYPIVEWGPDVAERLSSWIKATTSQGDQLGS